MKYKIAAIVSIIILIISAVVFSMFVDENDGERYIQHEKSQKYTPCAEACQGLCTHLPIIKIDTNGKEIPGRPIEDENGVMIGFTMAEDGNTTIKAHLDAVDNKEKNNHTYDKAVISSDIQIRVRGNSSRSFDKAGYFVRLIDEAGGNNPQAFLGMDSHHEWALHGPFLDKSLIRNYMWYNLSGLVMDYSPNVRFCEVILNDKYIGLYLAVETITAGQDGARLGLSVNRKDSTFTGYVVRLDVGNEGKMQNIKPFTNYTLRTLMRHDIIYPGKKNLTEELHEAIKDDFSYFEKVIYSYDIDDAKNGYKSLIDIDSFVDYFLINEIGCNYDAGWMSTYMYKDIDDKYRMCVWDFNSACDFYQDAIMPYNRFEMQNCLWYVMLFKDRDFTDRVIERYKEFRKSYFSDEYLNDFIDSTVEYLGPAIDRNWEVWGYSMEPGYDMLNIPERNPNTYESAITQLKGFFKQRLSWMDENIDILSQYSANSKVKKFNENAN